MSVLMTACSDPDKRTRGLDIINARVVELERAVFGERTLQPRNTESISGTYKFFPKRGFQINSSEDSGQISNQKLPGMTIYSENNSSLSFYGTTSTLNLLIPVDGILNDRQFDSERPDKRRKPSGRELEAASAISNRTLEDQIYATGDIHKAYGFEIQERIADAHFECFLGPVSDTIPVLAPSTLRAAYEQFWSSSPSDSETPISRQKRCLVYSVLALGSLYSNTGSDDTEWASYYFTEAQGLIGTLFSTNSLDTVQAAMMMVIIPSRSSPYQYLQRNRQFMHIT
jgi:hypothetical protein